MIIKPEQVSLLIGVTKTPATPIFFCDESGRSGPNYLDPGQPYHVLAGYMVPEHLAWKVTRALKPIRAELGDVEPKATRMLALPRRQTLLSRFLVEMGRDFFLAAVIVHKRYFAGSKLLQLFCRRDTGVGRTLRWESGPQTDAALAISRVSDGALKRLTIAIKEPCRASLRACLDQTVRELRDLGYGDLARLLRPAAYELTALAAAAERDVGLWDDGPPGAKLRAGASIDFDAFLWCLRWVNGLAENYARAPAHVVCDRVQEQTAFHRVFTAIRNVGGYSGLSKLTFADSATTEGVQAADLLAGAIRFFCRRDAPAQLQPGFDAIIEPCFTSPPKVEFFGPPDWVNTWREKFGDWWRRQQACRTDLVTILQRRR